jgi:hypothetical protein
MTQPPAIPFELQDHAIGQRMCGAAALCMVYRSFGLLLTQAEVWETIARNDASGNRAGRTYLLAADALRRGLTALVLQARRPWQTLAACWSAGVRVILNHRVRPSSLRGHFSVLAGLSDEQAWLHDPAIGPAQPIARADLLLLWSAIRGSEIAGQVLVAVAQPHDPTRTAARADRGAGCADRGAGCADRGAGCADRGAGCAVCGARPTQSARCAGCGRAVPLSPSAALGCPKWDCAGRLWTRLFCPHCDTVLIELPVAVAESTG